MGFEAFLAILAVAFVAGVAFSSKRLSSWQDAVEHVAARHGLEVEPGGLTKSASARGHVDGMFVVIDTADSDSSSASRVSVETDLPPAITLRREGFKETMKKAVLGGDLTLGLPAFDAEIVVRGPETDLLARLTPAARKTVMELVGRQGASLADSKLTWVSPKLMKEGAELRAALEGLLGLAADLRMGADEAPRRLAENVRSGPTPAFRLRCLRQLHAFERAPEAREAARRALAEDSDSEVRLAAAELLGPDEALDFVWKQVTKVPPLPLRQEATSVLARWAGDSDAAFEQVSELLTRSSGPVARVALEVFERRGSVPATSALDRASRDADPLTREAAARLLGVAPGDGHQPLLLGLLDDDADGVKAAAARSLGEVGDRDAVEPLLPLTKGTLTSSDVKSAAREAVERIQSRIGGASGGLAVAEEVELGALSPAEVAEGALSEAE